METALADAVWWKFSSAAVTQEPTFEEKQVYAMAWVKEFLLGIVREYQIEQGTKAVAAQLRDQVNAAIAQASTACVIEQVAE